MGFNSGFKGLKTAIYSVLFMSYLFARYAVFHCTRRTSTQAGRYSLFHQMGVL